MWEKPVVPTTAYIRPQPGRLCSTVQPMPWLMRKAAASWANFSSA